jgi:hypothetical protein
MSFITKLKKVEDFEKLNSYKGLIHLCCEGCIADSVFFFKL